MVIRLLFFSLLHVCFIASYCAFACWYEACSSYSWGLKSVGFDGQTGQKWVSLGPDEFYGFMSAIFLNRKHISFTCKYRYFSVIVISVSNCLLHRCYCKIDVSIYIYNVFLCYILKWDYCFVPTEVKNVGQHFVFVAADQARPGAYLKVICNLLC